MPSSKRTRFELLAVLGLLPGLAWGQDEPTWHGATTTQWVALGVAILLTALALVVLPSVITPIVNWYRKRRGAKVEPRSVRVRGLSSALSLVIVALAWRFLLDAYEMPLVVPLHRGMDVALIAGGAWLLCAAWDVMAEMVTARAGDLSDRAEHLLMPLIGKLVHGCVWIGGGLVVLSVFSVDWRGMLAGLGIGGLVVALAAKDSVENLFGSVTILFDMPFQIGDAIKVGPTEGTVEQINLRSTRIRTVDDAMVTLPNSNLIKAVVENQGARRTRRQKLTLHLGYQNPMSKVRLLLSKTRAYLDEQPWSIPAKTIVQLNDFADGSMSILILFFVDTSSYAEEVAARGQVIDHILAIAEELDLRFLTEGGPHLKDLDQK